MKQFSTRRWRVIAASHLQALAQIRHTEASALRPTGRIDLVSASGPQPTVSLEANPASKDRAMSRRVFAKASDVLPTSRYASIPRVVHK